MKHLVPAVYTTALYFLIKYMAFTSEVILVEGFDYYISEFFLAI